MRSFHIYNTQAYTDLKDGVRKHDSCMTRDDEITIIQAKIMYVISLKVLHFKVYTYLFPQKAAMCFIINTANY